MLTPWRAYLARPTGAAIRVCTTRVALVVIALVVEVLVLGAEVPGSIRASLVGQFWLSCRRQMSFCRVMVTVVRVRARLREVLGLGHQAVVACRVQQVLLIRVGRWGLIMSVVLLATMLEISLRGVLFSHQLSLLG